MINSIDTRYKKGNNVNKNKKNLNLIHWNVSLNETKLSDFRANMLLNYENYNVINKSRHQNKNGAGEIAILLKKNINFIQIVDNAFNEL